MRQHLGDGKNVAHVWAHQGQPSGRAGNVYFSGDTIYSYGNHFPMGQIVERKGRKVALITTRGYSVSTSKHIGWTYSAVSHMTTFRVPLGEVLTPRQQFETYQPRVVEAMTKASKARSHREFHINEAKGLVAEANSFAEFFGLKPRLSMPENIEEAIKVAKELDAKAKKRDAANQARVQRANEKRDAERREKALAALSSWREGQIGLYDIPHLHSLPATYLRLSPDGKKVETTESASVPVEHAERAYRIGLRLRERQQTYQRNGHSVMVGHYAVDSMDAAGHIVIGCHDIEWAEVENIAKAAGWSKEGLEMVELPQVAS